MSMMCNENEPMRKHICIMQTNALLIVLYLNKLISVSVVSDSVSIRKLPTKLPI